MAANLTRTQIAIGGAALLSVAVLGWTLMQPTRETKKKKNKKKNKPKFDKFTHSVTKLPMDINFVMFNEEGFHAHVAGDKRNKKMGLKFGARLFKINDRKVENLTYEDISTQLQKCKPTIKLTFKEFPNLEADWEKAEEYREKSNEYYKNGETEKGIEECTKAIKLHPTNKVYYSNRILMYLKNNQLDAALEDCQKIRELDPMSLYVKGHYLRGLVLFNLGKVKHAAAAFQTVMKLGPEFKQAKVRLDDCLRKLQVLEEKEEAELVEDTKNIPEMAKNGLDSVSKCLVSKDYDSIANESKQLLKASVKWEQNLYKNDKNAIKIVKNIEKNIEIESKMEAAKHETYLNMNEAKECTKQILSNVTGNLNDKNTLFQLISQLSPNSLFYDPKVKTNYAANNSNEDNKEDLESKENSNNPKNESIILKLSTVPGLDNLNIGNRNDSKKVQKQLISELKYSLDINSKNGNVHVSTHPILQKTQIALAEVYGVTMDAIIITNVYYGSCCFEYNIKGTKKHSDLIKDPTINTRLKQKFLYFESNKIHPSMLEAFNVNDFDIRGNKSFVGLNQTYEVGPPGKTQKYIQPNGWTRYGLNVLNGKYGNDHTWLDPFQHDNNWYRAYHGVRGVSGQNMGVAKIIQQNGFLPGTGQSYQFAKDLEGRTVGKGVYCTPDINVASGYAATLKLTLNDGTVKNFQMVFQVCVEPYQVRICKDCPNYWVAPNEIGLVGKNNHVEDNIRPYGILLKEV